MLFPFVSLKPVYESRLQDLEITPFCFVLQWPKKVVNRFSVNILLASSTLEADRLRVFGPLKNTFTEKGRGRTDSA